MVQLDPEARRCYRILWSGRGSGQHPTVTGKSSELHQKKDFIRKKPPSDMKIMPLLLININFKKSVGAGLLISEGTEVRSYRAVADFHCNWFQTGILRASFLCRSFFPGIQRIMGTKLHLKLDESFICTSHMFGRQDIALYLYLPF